jgi:hypothetical protein
MPVLRGPGPLADDFYLMSHDSLSGEPFLTDRVTGIGLAGALLGELAAQRRIDLSDDTVVVVDRRPPPDALTARMLILLKNERHPVRDWLAFFGRTAVDDVAARLVHLGVLARRPSRIPWRGNRWAPIHPNSAALPAATLCTRLIRGESLNEHHTMLAGLTAATGLDERVFWEVRTVAPDALRDVETDRGHGRQLRRQPPGLSNPELS